MLKRVIVLLGILFWSCGPEVDSILLEEFRVDKAEKLPKISLHRGGLGIAGYPENCLETMSYFSERLEGIYEIDVSMTRDGQLVLFHDNSLDRTSTGSGALKKFSLEELSEFYLKDEFGTVTSFKIPLFKDVLQWAKKEGVILTVDIKRNVPLEAVLKEIRKAQAEDHSIIITYDLEQALKAYKTAPHLMLSVSARNYSELKALLESGIPTRNMIAFTGTRLSNIELYKRLKEENILSMLGTLGNLDKMAKTRGDHLYTYWLSMGINIIATDRPLEVNRAITENQ